LVSKYPEVPDFEPCQDTWPLTTLMRETAVAPGIRHVDRLMLIGPGCIQQGIRNWHWCRSTQKCQISNLVRILGRKIQSNERPHTVTNDRSLPDIKLIEHKAQPISHCFNTR